MNQRSVWMCAISFAGFWVATWADGRTMADDLRLFLDSYCIQCHGEAKQKGERRFDKLASPYESEDGLLDLQDILDQLVLGEMPPKKAKQPSIDEKQSTIAWLTKSLEEAHATRTSTGGQTVLRRLNRREYLNTIRDLFDFNMSMFDPTTKFPRDQTVEHLDNVGDTLVTSGYLLQQFLFAADQVVEKAFRRPDDPIEQTWNFSGPFYQQPEVDRAHAAAFDNRYLCLYECPNSERPEGAFGPLLKFRQGVPSDGFYEVRVQVEAMNRENPYDASIIGVDPAEPLRIGIIPGSARLGTMHVGQPFQTVLAEKALPDGGPHWHTFVVWLDEGFSPRFIFPNGMLNIRDSYAKIINRHRNLFPKREGRGGIVANRIDLFSHGQVPHLRIHEVSIRGPLAETPSSPRHRIVGDEQLTQANVREKIHSFADRAYRRPVEQGEIDRLMAVIEARLIDGHSLDEAFQDGLKTILCSSAFLYLHQPSTEESNSRLSAHGLASRLSYFIWSSMPDEELRRAADSEEILKPDILRQQVQRMLADPKSDSFITGFLDSWLNLRALGDMPPDRESFVQYYSQGLQDAMRRETFLFARQLVDENKSIVEFLNADYSFVNRSLAKLYDVEEQVPILDGEQFHRVQFTDPNRGGLLGQGSVLTVTANGVETSPVIRGVWLLENILGTPPSPPPDDVPAIDPDVRGAVSMRDLLTKHRESPACFECHQKIDPLGFALESFDPIGRWRNKYENSSKVDAAGVLPSGETFDDLAGLKNILVRRDIFFSRMLTEKLLAYACGRRMEPADRAAIGQLAAELREQGYPFRTLIEQIVLSEIFRSN